MGRWAQGDVSTVPICISEESSHSGDPDQVLSDDDLPPDKHVDLVSPASPTVSARMSPDSLFLLLFGRQILLHRFLRIMYDQTVLQIL